MRKHCATEKNDDLPVVGTVFDQLGKRLSNSSQQFALQETTPKHLA